VRLDGPPSMAEAAMDAHALRRGRASSDSTILLVRWLRLVVGAGMAPAAQFSHGAVDMMTAVVVAGATRACEWRFPIAQGLSQP
jgi:hypothetical protein